MVNDYLRDRLTKALSSLGDQLAGVVDDGAGLDEMHVRGFGICRLKRSSLQSIFPTQTLTNRGKEQLDLMEYVIFQWRTPTQMKWFKKCKKFFY